MTFRFGAQGVVMGMTACVVLLAGCGGDSGYFRVRNPGVETTYYTTRIATERGVVRFKDEQTGDIVTLQSSEVKKISKQEFMQGATAPALTVGAQWPSMPAAAGASAPPTKRQ